MSLVVNQSISCAEHFRLIYYELGHSLLQAGKRITKCVNFFANWGKHSYKIGQLCIRSMYYKKGRFVTVGPVLQIEARDIEKLGR